MANESENNFTAETLDKIFSQTEGKPKGGNAGRKQLGDKKKQQELELALTVILVDLASCDQNFDRSEYHFIGKVLREIFGTTPDEVKPLVNQAITILSNLRGTNSYADLLAENLPDEKKHLVLEAIDTMIDIDGVEDGFETYHRARLERMLFR